MGDGMIEVIEMLVHSISDRKGGPSIPGSLRSSHCDVVLYYEQFDESSYYRQYISKSFYIARTW